MAERLLSALVSAAVSAMEGGFLARAAEKQQAKDELRAKQVARKKKLTAKTAPASVPATKPPRPESATEISGPLVEATGVAYTYKGDSERSLDGVSIALQAGQTVGLVGCNACGKSTLARCLTLKLQPQSGTVVYHVPIGDPPPTPSACITHWTMAGGAMALFVAVAAAAVNAGTPFGPRLVAAAAGLREKPAIAAAVVVRCRRFNTITLFLGRPHEVHGCGRFIWHARFGGPDRWGYLGCWFGWSRPCAGCAASWQRGRRRSCSQSGRCGRSLRWLDRRHCAERPFHRDSCQMYL